MNTIFKHIKGDRTIWSIVAVLAIFSFMPVYSASTNLVYVVGSGSTIGYLIKHMILLIMGFVIIYGVHKVPYRYFSGGSVLLLPVVILLLVSALVFVAACLGVSAMLLSSIRERKREIQLLRVIGAPAYFLFFLIELEALLIALVSCVLGAGLLATCLAFSQDYLVSHFGLHVGMNFLTGNNLTLMVAIVFASAVVAIFPSFSGYRQARIVKN